MAMVASRRRSASAASLCIAWLWLLPVANALDDVRMVRTAWGVDEFERPEQWTQWMVGISELYQGVEVPTWVVCSGFPSYDGTCTHACNATRAAGSTGVACSAAGWATSGGARCRSGGGTASARAWRRCSCSRRRAGW